MAAALVCCSDQRFSSCSTNLERLSVSTSHCAANERKSTFNYLSYTARLLRHCPVRFCTISLSQLLNNVANTVNETIICGDFNITYNNSQSTGVANFPDLLDCAGFIQHVTGSTHVSGNVLDRVITHRCSNIITSPVIPTTLLIFYFAKGEPRNVEYCKVFFVDMQYMVAQD